MKTSVVPFQGHSEEQNNSHFTRDTVKLCLIVVFHRLCRFCSDLFWGVFTIYRQVLISDCVLECSTRFSDSDSLFPQGENMGWNTNYMESFDPVF